MLAVAGAAVWSPRAINTWLSLLGAGCEVVRHARLRPATAPSGAEPLGADVINRLAAIDDDAARRALEDARRCGAHIATQTSEEYPSKLKDLQDPPPALYYRGNLSSLYRRTVAIVGSRSATAYGRGVAAALARDFGLYDAAIVSGLARGVDAAAHRGALDAKIPTIAVIGSGLAALYPQYHGLLADEIIGAGGAVLSEFPPGFHARPHHFPMRNRIVAALADTTIVVEAGPKSGALITARLADDLGRRVFAIPGDIGRLTSEGTNNLIKDGVALVTGATDTAGLMGWTAQSLPLAAKQADPLLRFLDTHGSAIDELSRKTRTDAATLAAHLTILELNGVVERKAGGLFCAVNSASPSNHKDDAHHANCDR